ncbi:MAG: class III signal peptide-containing protein [archaeon]|jgi:uncharacterized protein (UPF0333 family)
MQKGQVALEFIFLLLIVIVYLTTVTMPLGKETTALVNDVESVTKANNEVQKLTNAINEVSLLGVGSRKTVTVFAPQDTNIYCNAASISFETKLNQQPYPKQCPSGNCRKDFAIKNAILDCKLNLIKGPVKTNIIIEKTLTNITFTN